MRRVAAALLITCLFGGHSIAQPVPTSALSVKPSAAELDAFIERGMKDWRIPGLSIVVVHDGASAYEKGFGVLRLGAASRVDAQTLFGMMSTTKAMTALAVAMLVDGREGWIPIGFTLGLDGSVSGLIFGSPDMTFTRARAPAK